MSADSPAEQADEAIDDPVEETAEASAEITDPDDIDALLESMSADSPAEQADEAIDDLVEETAEKTAEEAVNEDGREHDNTAKIDSFTEDYVAPFLATDFSDLIQSQQKEDANSLPDDIESAIPVNEDDDFDIDDLLAEVQDENKVSSDGNEAEEIATDNENQDDIIQMDDDDFDIDDLLAEVQDENEVSSDGNEAEETGTKNESQDDIIQMDDEDFDIDALLAEVGEVNDETDLSSLDIGDDLEDMTSESGKADENDIATLDDETLSALDSDFDEAALLDLLNDEDPDDNDPNERNLEFTPDFSDHNVLADLLADNDSENESENSTAEANEIEDIQELDNLDFDELLANIEDESNLAASNEPVDFNQGLEVGDEVSDFNLKTDFDTDKKSINTDESNDDFVSVDSLISDSMDAMGIDEPYDKNKIDVGLSEFPEFASGDESIDVDDDDNSMAAKLDLAKVYMEIGDQDNATVILQDILKQGDAQQQYDAQQLLDSLE